MKKTMFLLLLLPFLVNAQVTLDWQQFQGGLSLATDDTDNLYSIYWDYNPAGDIYLNKHDAAGNFMWTVSYDNTDNTRHEVATWVETDNDNNIIVTGTIRSGYASPVNAASVIMKFDPSGNLLWRNVYETSFDGSYTVKCLVDADNNIYVLGLGSNGVGMVTKVKKFAADGTAMWSYFNVAGIGAPMNFKFTPDNNIVIIGRGTVGSINGYAKIDMDGNEIWSYAGVNSLTIGDAAGDLDGNTYIINGEYVVAGVQGSILTKLSPTGSALWSHTNDITGTKVEVGTDNYPVIGGFPSAGSPGVAMMKYNTTGTPLWTNLDADGPDQALLLHNIMKMDIANNIYFGAGTLFQQAVCKVNADGTNDWIALASSGYNTDFEFGNDYSLFMLGGIALAHFIQDPIITCDAPVGLFTNNITTVKARLNWTVEPGAFQYEVWYKKATAINWKKKFVPGVNNKLNLKNLQCGTNYVWQIRTICDTIGVDEISAWSHLQAFSTLACRAGDNIESDESTISLYPNPATTSLTVVMNSDIQSIQIFDMTGKLVFNQNIETAESIQLDISEWNSGIYLVQSVGTSGTTTEKLVVQH
ncbi:MAG: T9SS type A sorting domain-containing protein [Bacteroidetes bacterium]|nr:T9SS type A sorting domain-containing protein [Bacteroidota bacterium]